MWYYGEHRRSWWKTHSLDLLTAAGITLVFALPVWLLFT